MNSSKVIRIQKFSRLFQREHFLCNESTEKHRHPVV